MGISPEIWGPTLWGTIHYTCLTGSATNEFINGFADAIPCPACGQHFKQMLQELPFPESHDPLILFEWSVNIHNRVNARIGKPIISVEQAMELWTRQKTTEYVPKQIYLLGIILLIALIFIFIKK